MTTIIGQNTPASAELRGIVDEVERVNAAIKELQESRKAIYAAAQSRGFSAKRIREIVKIRTYKPQDYQDAVTEQDIYLHAMGMANEPPLFRQIEAMANDSLAGEKLLEAFKLLCPVTGDLIVTIMGKRVRIWRDKDGNPQSQDYEPIVTDTRAPSVAPRPPKKDVPDCTPEEADELGFKAAKANVPVIDNPFPYGDPRRARWDEGWRRGAGNDGFGKP